MWYRRKHGAAQTWMVPTRVTSIASFLPDTIPVTNDISFVVSPFCHWVGLLLDNVLLCEPLYHLYLPPARCKYIIQYNSNIIYWFEQFINLFKTYIYLISPWIIISILSYNYLSLQRYEHSFLYHKLEMKANQFYAI